MKNNLEDIFSTLLCFEKFVIRYPEDGFERHFFVESLEKGFIYGKPINFEMQNNYLSIEYLEKKKSLDYSVFVRIAPQA